MTTTQAANRSSDARPDKLRGHYPTPPALVHRVVDAVMPPVAAGQRISVLDPACGDGRFLLAAIDHVAVRGGRSVVRGIDVDSCAVDATIRSIAELQRRDQSLVATIELGDALALDWADAEFDVVLGNPPYLSQMAAATTRGRSSVRGGGPYADVAAEFLALAVELARPDGGRVGLVLPQSILASRDARNIRADVDRRAEIFWSWWSASKQFDADVLVCALGFERRRLGIDGNSTGHRVDPQGVWSAVVSRSLGVPALPPAHSNGTAGDRATFTANFRDEYYGMVPGVGDHDTGPRLITSGLIDPNRCWWGERAVTFNKRRFARPRLDLSVLSERMQSWAGRLAVPKVLIANQTRIIECFVDRDGSMLPGVPVVTARPIRPVASELDAIAAVLSSPFASAWSWHRAAGTGLGARAMRLGPGMLAELPWPSGSLDVAVDAWRCGDLASSAKSVHTAYGIGCAGDLATWWSALLP